MAGGIRYERDAELCVVLCETISLPGGPPPGSEQGLVCHWYVSLPNGCTDHSASEPFVAPRSAQHVQLDWCAFLVVDANAEADLRLTVADVHGNHLGVYFGTVKQLAASEKFEIRELMLENVNGVLAVVRVHAAAQVRWTHEHALARAAGACQFLTAAEDAQAQHIWNFLYPDQGSGQKPSAIVGHARNDESSHTAPQQATSVGLRTIQEEPSELSGELDVSLEDERRDGHQQAVPTESGRHGPELEPVVPSADHARQTSVDKEEPASGAAHVWREQAVVAAANGHERSSVEAGGGAHQQEEDLPPAPAAQHDHRRQSTLAVEAPPSHSTEEPPPRCDTVEVVEGDGGMAQAQCSMAPPRPTAERRRQGAPLHVGRARWSPVLAANRTRSQAARPRRSPSRVRCRQVPPHRDDARLGSHQPVRRLKPNRKPSAGRGLAHGGRYRLAPQAAGPPSGRASSSPYSHEPQFAAAH